jgi:hypothetical protein
MLREKHIVRKIDEPIGKSGRSDNNMSILGRKQGIGAPKLSALSMMVATFIFVASMALASGGNIENDGRSYVGRTVVITGHSAVPSSFCNISYGKYSAVVIEPHGNPAIFTDISLPAGMEVRPGNRFKVMAQRSCGSDRLILDIEKE